jgi:hypothetical protein
MLWQTLRNSSSVEAFSAREAKREPAAEILSEAKDLLREAEVGSSDRQSALIARAIAWTVNSVSLRPPTEPRLDVPKAQSSQASLMMASSLERVASDGNQIGFFLTEQ